MAVDQNWKDEYPIDSLPDFESAYGKTLSEVSCFGWHDCVIVLKFSDGTSLVVRPCCCYHIGPTTISHQEARDARLITRKQLNEFRRRHEAAFEHNRKESD